MALDVRSHHGPQRPKRTEVTAKYSHCSVQSNVLATETTGSGSLSLEE